MADAQTNPLNKFFRQPGIYIGLPSQGQWWPDETLVKSLTGELPIYPMSSRDEITLRTPDALLNGQGVVDVIQSCCPNIKNAWAMPSVDVDAVLIAIRIASYGNEMPFDSVCPHCQEENSHDADLGGLLSAIKCPDYSKPVSFKGLQIKLKPQPYFQVNRSNKIEFEEQRLLKALEMNPETESDQRAKMITDSMNRLVDIGVESLTTSTESITLPDGLLVDNPEFIREFYSNLESVHIRELQDTLAKLASEAKLQAVTVQCDSCKDTYSVELGFDYASFFAKGS